MMKLQNGGKSLIKQKLLAYSQYSPVDASFLIEERAWGRAGREIEGENDNAPAKIIKRKQTYRIFITG